MEKVCGPTYKGLKQRRPKPLFPDFGVASLPNKGLKLSRGPKPLFPDFA